MASRGEHSIRFKPRTVGDTVSGDDRPPGVCASLAELIWDPSTPNCLICRPANSVMKLITGLLSGNNILGAEVTAAYQVGNVVYGLVSDTFTFPGQDYPFAYNTVTQAFVDIAGIVGADLPLTQASSGEWTPPQITLTGSVLVFTHVGFDGLANFFGSLNIANPAAPVWATGNTATHGLPSVPQAAQTFNNRTYFFCGNTAYYTDTLALAMTSATQSFTLGDTNPVSAAGPLPVGTTSQGIVQGVLAFKNSQVFLITGDATGSTLAVNLLSTSVGTMAPRSVVPTPEGVRFMANDGIRDVNFYGVVSQPDPDLALPFIYALVPSRVAAGFSGNIYRICVQNGNTLNSDFQDYWFDYQRRGWTGPHSFSYTLAVALSNDFVLANGTAFGIAALFNSYSVQAHDGTGNTFIEVSVQLNWTYETCPMTDLDNIYANSMDKATIDIASPSTGQTYSFTAQDESGTALAAGSINEPTAQTIWGSFTWGLANWGAQQAGLKPITIPWDSVAVFNRLSIEGRGASSLGLKLGAYRVGYKRLNYLLN